MATISKKKIAEWAKVQLPEWSAVFQNGVEWKEAGIDMKVDFGPYFEIEKIAGQVN